MILDAEEKHQVDQIKIWFKSYGTAVVVGILIATALFLGYQRWQQMNERSIVHASRHYEQLLDSVSAKDDVAAQKHADYLINRYPKSTYAKLATLLLAHTNIDKGKYAEAMTQLKWVMDKASVPSLRAIARLRYARVQVQQGQATAALTTLQSMDAAEYLAPAEEIKGDAYVAMHNDLGAKQAYQNALQALPETALNRPLLQMKLNNIATDASSLNA